MAASTPFGDGAKEKMKGGLAGTAAAEKGGVVVVESLVVHSP